MLNTRARKTTLWAAFLLASLAVAVSGCRTSAESDTHPQPGERAAVEGSAEAREPSPQEVTEARRAAETSVVASADNAEKSLSPGSEDGRLAALVGSVRSIAPRTQSELEPANAGVGSTCGGSDPSMSVRRVQRLTANQRIAPEPGDPLSAAFDRRDSPGLRRIERDLVRASEGGGRPFSGRVHASHTVTVHSGSLPQSDADAVVQGFMQSYERCLMHESQSTGDSFQGEATLSFDVAPDGSVSALAVDGLEERERMGRCLQRRSMRLRFPEATDVSSVSVDFSYQVEHD